MLEILKIFDKIFSTSFWLFLVENFFSTNFSSTFFERLFSNFKSPEKTSKMGRRDKGKKKAVAQGSDVFTMFEKTQLQEFKEAFEMIDSNRDGFIDKNDLKST